MLAAKKKAMKELDLEIVTPRKWLADRVKQSFLKDIRVTVIHNGIDIDIFKETKNCNIKSELKIPIENKVILAVAPNIMSESKGGEWVLKLASIMNDKNISFVIIGAKEINDRF